ncbi:hypothetical protein N6P31_16120 [Pectobacterium betavasculorum]|uniref:hypothetical protein n=1 Tax=Pectobacterium betavasculorum TaxID=55207 RepID=UPI00313D91C5
MTISTAGMIEAVRTAANMTKTQEEQDVLNSIANRIEILTAANAGMDLQLNSIRAALNIPVNTSVQAGVIAETTRLNEEVLSLRSQLSESVSLANKLRRTAKEHQEENQLLRTELADQEKQPLFMYGIAAPDGKAYFDEFCVSADLGLIEDVVANLNYDREDGDELNYSVVSLYRDHPLNSAERERLNTLEKVVAGLPQEAIDGGWTAADISAHAKSLEERIAAYDRAAKEPVAWTDEQELRDVNRDGCGYLFTVNPITPNADMRRVIPLFKRSPLPVVLDEVTEFTKPNSSYEWRKGYNACIAVLQSGNPVWSGIDWAKGCEPTQAVPEGWALVPAKATAAMVSAAGRAARKYMEEYGGNNPQVIYQAMLAAAPQLERKDSDA